MLKYMGRGDIMYSLFIDTHYLNLVIVLYKDGVVVDKNELINIRNQSEVLVPSIVAILDNNHLTIDNLGELIVVNGPGSFTGVRLGVTVAKTMAYLKNIPIKAISSLQVLASNVDNDQFQVSIPENNGMFIGKFNNDFLNPQNIYIKKEDMDTYVTNNNITIVKDIDYNKLYKKISILPNINPHLVNPLYIKTIEVHNDKKSAN